MKKIIISAFLSLGAFFTASAAFAYTDVPKDHWAYSAIERAAETRIMSGRDDGSFGLGENIKRSEFAAMLCRLMGWETVSAPSSFNDVPESAWYFDSVNTLSANGAAEKTDRFRPEESITRGEMAVMLVKSLGLGSLSEENFPNPFGDVSENSGYISIAYDLGIITGIDENRFAPDNTALREEGAAMMTRLFGRYSEKLSEVHGFYAISSWSSRETASSMDRITFGWSSVKYDPETGVRLDTSGEGGSSWKFPEGFGDALSYFREKQIPGNLGVFADGGDTAFLTDPAGRASAIEAIASKAAEFEGVTIDFEGMKGNALKEGFTEFLRGLKSAVGEKALYTAVQPVLYKSDTYYDAYDYRAIGEISDRVILMAHNYAPLSMDENLLNTDFIATPVTPFYEVYYALKAVTDPVSGVSDPDKIILGLSVSDSAAWNLTDGKISDPKPAHPSVDTIVKRLAQADTRITYSEKYRNPYAFYRGDNGQEILLWYENEQSVRDKIMLARMFGVNSVSIWRIGAMAEDHSVGMDIPGAVFSMK